MKIVGLSGGIASGKNSVAQIFSKLGAEVFDADLLVHQLFLHDQQVINELSNYFPESMKNGVIDRKILSQIIAKNPQKITLIENIIHPIVRNNYKQFISKNVDDNKDLIILNIPLLHEKSYYKTDKIIAIIANEEIRRNRFIQRSNSDYKNTDKENLLSLNKKFLLLKNKQISDEERIKLADFIIVNNSDFIDLEKQVAKIFKKLY